ncbi:hypothetical protein D3C72_2325760 [compost metagenome]
MGFSAVIRAVSSAGVRAATASGARKSFPAGMRRSASVSLVMFNPPSWEVQFAVWRDECQVS